LIPVAQSAFSAQWQAPTLDGSVVLSGGPPTPGQLPIATSGTTATWQNPNSGVELLTATAGSSQGTPVGDLNLAVEVSILVNTTGAAAYWNLPDGTDGVVKEIVSGGNLGSALISNAFIGITSTNNAYGTNDLIDLNPSNSVRLVWSTAGGGWVAISSCVNASSQWD
jgi:hypothetical protein